MRGFVVDRTHQGTEVQTDWFNSYKDLDKLHGKHEVINHSADQFARKEGRKMVTTDGCESTFGGLKAIITGVFHRVSVKHLPYYLDKVFGKRNRRELDASEQMGEHRQSMMGKRIKYECLTALTPEQEAAYQERQYEEFGILRDCLEAAGMVRLASGRDDIS